MRRNNRKPILEEEMGSKKIVYISIAILIIAIVAFTITFFVYSNKIEKQNNTAKSKITQDLELSSSKNKNEVTNPASSSMGKTVNEMTNEQSNTTSNTANENSNTTNTTNTGKVAINTSNMEKQEDNNTSKVEDKATTTVAEPKKDPEFAKPVEGEVLKEFAKDALLYSETLKEWTTHNGVDIKAEKTTVVKASAEGTVKSIKNDPRYGLTIVIEHDNGFSSVYSNLLSSEFVKEGEKVKQGQSIGTVGNTATFEIADEVHLHFEIMKNGEYLDPSIYLK